MYAAARRIADGLRRTARPADREDATEAFIAAAPRCLRPGPGPEEGDPCLPRRNTARGAAPVRPARTP
nr:hypothetical protein [Streptomyces sp. DSM 41633]